MARGFASEFARENTARPTGVQPPLARKFIRIRNDIKDQPDADEVSSWWCVPGSDFVEVFALRVLPHRPKATRERDALLYCPGK